MRCDAMLEKVANDSRTIERCVVLAQSVGTMVMRRKVADCARCQLSPLEPAERQA